MTDPDRRAGDQEFPLKHDTTATERHRMLSINIRRAILDFMQSNVGQLFQDTALMTPWENMCAQAANWARTRGGLPKCDTTTAGRWIKVYSAPGEDFDILAQSAGLMIIDRRAGAKA